MAPRRFVQSPIYATASCAVFLVVLAAPGWPRLLGPTTNHPEAYEIRWAGVIVAFFWSGVCWFMALACRPVSPNPRVLPAESIRVLYTFGCLGCLFHIALAFHVGHEWSHQKAFEHVERGSGVGEGIFVNYLFVLVWIVDALWTWIALDHYLNRPRWLNCTVHGFMGFIVFNAAVVFGSGLTPWIIVITFIWQIPFALRHWRWLRESQLPTPATTAIAIGDASVNPAIYNNLPPAPSAQTPQQSG